MRKLEENKNYCNSNYVTTVAKLQQNFCNFQKSTLIFTAL